MFEPMDGEPMGVASGNPVEQKPIAVIGDIAGRFDELMELLKKLPHDSKIICVGDIMDRGPKSKQVIEYMMAHPEITCLYGNHEDMMVCSLEGTGYDVETWLMNGGATTLASYGLKVGDTWGDLKKAIPKEHIKWLKTRPRFFENDELIVTHAPVTWDVDDLRTIQDQMSFIWNRIRPTKRTKHQVYGHNSSIFLHGADDNNWWATCIDNSSNRELCAFVWPSREIVRQPYLDET